ncbi:copper chaperone PCu(A)C [Herbidospora sp. RD11066]
MTTTSRRVIAIAAFLAAAPALAACGAGTDANTNKPYAPTEAGVLIRDGAYGVNGIKVSQAYMLGPDPGGQIPAGGTVPLYLSITNDTTVPDTLLGITPDANAAATAQGGAVPLPAGTLVHTGTGANPQIQIQGVKSALRGGESIPLTLNFQNAGQVTMVVPVITRNREYATLPPVPGAIPAPSPTAAASPAAGESSGH